MLQKRFWCENIVKSYNGAAVVCDINISVNENELVSLLGVSGVGKTTLFNILSGVDKPDSGKVFLDGDNITGMAGKVSYMLQKDLLFPHKTIIDNVSLPLVIKGLSPKEARKDAAKYFEQFGLLGSEDRYPSQLSGGMRQRAALLRTHLLGGNVMLLDEPFSALDAITKLSMHNWYLKIMEQIPRSTLFITHDIDEALMLSDRIYIMSGVPGRIVNEFIIEEKRPRATSFITSELFMQYKRDILDAILAK